jgi:hypothetical protein
MTALNTALFHIRPQRNEWLVVEEAGDIGGVFATLMSAVEFVRREARRFRSARTIIEFASRAVGDRGL